MKRQSKQPSGRVASSAHRRPQTKSARPTRKRTASVHTDADGDPLFGLDPKQALALPHEITPAEEKEMTDQLDAEAQAWEDALVRAINSLPRRPEEEDIDL